MKILLLSALIINIVELISCIRDFTKYESQLIDVRFMSRRDFNNQPELSFEAFGKQYQLHLTPISVFSEEIQMYDVQKSPDGQTIFEQSYSLTQKDIGILYSPSEAFGSVIAEMGSYGIQVEGIVDDIYIKPPEASMGSLFRDSPSNHVAFKIGKGGFAADTAFKNADNDSYVEMDFIPNEVIVEILAVIDFKNSRRMDFDKRNIAKYVAIQYGTIQRIYSIFTYPAIKFLVKGIYVITNENTQTFIHNNLVNDSFVTKQTLDDFIPWAFDNKKISADIAVLHMDYLILLSQGKKAVGLTYVGTACDHGALIAQDEAPYFIGYLTIAHELGHLLGADHDGAPRSTNCKRNLGYLMGTDQYNSMKYYPSECSFYHIKTFIRSTRALCLTDFYSGMIPAINAYPGDVMSTNLICQKKYGMEYFARQWPEPYSCSMSIVCCKNNIQKDCKWVGPMEIIDGNACGQDKICYKGRCVLRSPISNQQKLANREPTFIQPSPNIGDFVEYFKKKPTSSRIFKKLKFKRFKTHSSPRRAKAHKF